MSGFSGKSKLKPDRASYRGKYFFVGRFQNNTPVSFFFSADYSQGAVASVFFFYYQMGYDIAVKIRLYGL
jgi:hypothetical protein